MVLRKYKYRPVCSATRVDTKLICVVNKYNYFYFETLTSNYLIRRSMILHYMFKKNHFLCPNKHILSPLRIPTF